MPLRGIRRIRCSQWLRIAQQPLRKQRRDPPRQRRKRRLVFLAQQVGALQHVVDIGSAEPEFRMKRRCGVLVYAPWKVVGVSVAYQMLEEASFRQRGLPGIGQGGG